MKLYHGSNVIISDINLDKCRPYKDFGKGFYCTAIEEQAELMAKRVAKIYGGTPHVTVFDFDENIISSNELNIKSFESPTKEWAIFVLNNRDRSFKEINSINCNIDNKYDIVAGPVADDDLALLFRTFTRGLIDINVLVKEMSYKKFSNQYSFHTQKAIQYLKFFGGK
ncbi:DUF3990 domain-containing protein [Clostridium sp. MB40-C1]|uniref:DUF3990 domain-containing protein n=1 Tax=Clostridium sp. MB40-C1 TaxID=3070996 RepID=UPI0027DF0CBF|nr:DUF3990 domain-containing protein [Clostridium sp. MB40-C1]WMJ81445.1 DUF3990 domain-containing protein [Clostridium sp. MB40-C1]